MTYNHIEDQSACSTGAAEDYEEENHRFNNLTVFGTQVRRTSIVIHFVTTMTVATSFLKVPTGRFPFS